MPFSVVAAGSSLQLIYTDGTIATVTLPAGITINPLRRSRFTILGRNVIVVNGPTKPIWIDPDGVCRPCSIPTPTRAPVVAAGAADTLSGTFRVAFSNVIKTDLGLDLMESDRSPASAPVTTANQAIAVSAIQTSGETLVNCRRVYRTSTGPSEDYYEWFDLDDNTTTAYEDGASDASLSLLPAPDDLGQTPARLTLIQEWKGRLWGVSPTDPDSALFSSDGKFYAWPVTNNLPVRPVGADRFGVVGIVPRRDELAFGKRDIIWKVIGDDEDSFRLVKLVEGKGILGADTINVNRDVARWLSDDGVYEWDSAGVRCITDDDVKGWFTTDDYFNRATFPQAFSRYNPLKHAYELFLSAVGSTVFDRWISYDIARKKWLGPHKTDAFTPSGAGVVLDSSELALPVVGGTDGYLYKITPGTFRDGAATAIALDVMTTFHTGNAPDIEHFWGLMSVLTRKLAAGTLTITGYVGGTDAAAGTAFAHLLTTGRQKLRRLGHGRLMKLRFQNSEVNQETEIYGYELPYHELGRR